MPAAAAVHVRRTVALAAALAAATGCSKALPVADGAELCYRCHGGENGNAAPPRTAGDPATAALAVGAHQQHLTGTRLRAPIACDECHVVPGHDWPSVKAHVDGTAGVSFPGVLAWSGRGAAPAWNPATRTCTGTYCHGATLNDGGRVAAPDWTLLDGTQVLCGACHGFPPVNGIHPQGAGAAACHTCHPTTAGADDASIVAGGTHLDGKIDAPNGCAGCHPAGVPPPTGAHLAHVFLANPADGVYGDLRILADTVAPGTAPLAAGRRYFFGCGYCHPTDEATFHRNGTVDVQLDPAAAPGTLRGRNAAGAAYAPATGTCSGVYCHSSGQADPVYADTPGWSSGATLSCAGCHGDPPAYASGGAGSATANSHVGLDGSGWETGHFAGMPGPAHNSKHGGGDPAIWQGGAAASPISCEVCHAATVDPAARIADGRFYYYDPTGDYSYDGVGDPRLPRSGDLTRFGTSAWAASQCTTCHSVPADARGGRVLPLRHVDGTRDVVFDRRTALPAGYPADLPPLATADPIRPFYVYAFGLSRYTLPADAALRDVAGTTAPAPQALTLHLASASYDPATRTCSAVACHLAQAQVAWGAPFEAPGSTFCSSCHPGY